MQFSDVVSRLQLNAYGQDKSTSSKPGNDFIIVILAIARAAIKYVQYSTYINDN